MSNELSPRDVCSITIGINGLMSDRLLTAGGPQFRLGRLLFLVRGPDRVSGCGLLGRDPLDFSSNVVESAGEPRRLALCLVGARSLRLLDHPLWLLEALAESLVDLLVG